MTIILSENILFLIQKTGYGIQPMVRIQSTKHLLTQPPLYVEHSEQILTIHRLEQVCVRYTNE